MSIERITQELAEAVGRYATCVERLVDQYAPARKSLSDIYSERIYLMADILYAIYGEGLLSLLGDTEFLQKAFDESKVVRDYRGRFAPKGSPELLEQTHQLVRDNLANAKTRQSLEILIENLSDLTVKQLHEIKKRFGIKASGRTKDELLRKLAHRLDVGRREERAKATSYTTPIQVLDKENEIIKDTTESLHIFDRDGNLLHSLGDGHESQVMVPEEVAKDFKGRIATHNHPRGWTFPESDPRRGGSSFSLADIGTSVANGLTEMRAVSPRYRHSMIFGQEFGMDYLREKVLPAHRKIDQEVRSKWMDRIASGDTLSEKMELVKQAEASHSHEVMTGLAKQMGWTYERTAIGRVEE